MSKSSYIAIYKYSEFVAEFILKKLFKPYSIIL